MFGLTDFCRRFLPRPSHRRRRSQLPILVAEPLELRQLLAASGLNAVHRSGQTFLTWTEDGAVTGEQYHVYRSSEPITTANIGQAQKLTAKWGALDDNTSVHTNRASQPYVPTNFVISDLAAPLSSSSGLFVWTTQAGQSGTWYYAVTQVTNGTESLTLTAGANSLSTGVTEAVATPQPVLTYSTNGGKGRVYTQYMDYANWNPTFQGYAYNYSVALPDTYSTSQLWPVKIMPHAYGERFRMEPSAEYGWPCIEIFLDDSGGGAPGETFQTWWYGFSADHNYRTGGNQPTSGVIENFTEQRVLKAIDEVLASFSADPLRIHMQGHSMGASGSVSLGMRYPNVLAGIYASEPMTNYKTSPGFQNDFTVLWGSQTANLPIVNRGPRAAALQQYNGTGVYDWMNHHEQLISRRGDDMAFLMVGHGKADDIIDWATQGRPFIAALNAAGVGFTAEQRGGWDHNWMSFDFSHDAMFSPADGGLSDWAYLRTMSFPGISNATGSGPNVPGSTGTNYYNLNIEWSVPWNNFHTGIVDTTSRYEITLRSTSGAQQAEITPRRTQAFDVAPGAVVNWQNLNAATNAVVQSGSVTADANGLVTIPRFQIGTGTGNRLVITLAAPATPALTAPAATTTSQMPTITWNAVAGAASYDVFIGNLSTGQNPQVSTNVATSSYTPPSALGLGRYRVWVRARSAAGLTSNWSAARDFRITTAPVLNQSASPDYSGTPLITWSALPGAAKYDIWINNTSTGQSQVLRNQNLTTTSYQVPTNLGLGVHTVWLRGIDAAGNAGSWSSAMQFTSATRPTVTAPAGPTFASSPTFQWNAVAGANRYEVSVINRTTNVTVLSQTGITGTSWTPSTALPNANYRWWVRASSTTSHIVGGWSTQSDFNTGGKPSLLTAPGSTSNRRPPISWTTVQGAVRYELWVSRVTGGVVINETALTSTTFVPGSDLAAGTYRIWVRAVSGSNVISDWSTSVDLTIV